MDNNHVFHTRTALAIGLKALFKELEDRLSLRKKFIKLRELRCGNALEAKGVAAVAAIGRPIFHLLGIERGLCAGDSGT